MSSDEINEGPLIFVHLQPFAIPSAHQVSHLGNTYRGEDNKQSSSAGWKRALSGLCSCISTIIVSSDTQYIHLHSTNTVKGISVPSIQLNQDEVMKIVVGKMSQLISDDFIAWGRHYKSLSAGHWTRSH